MSWISVFFKKESTKVILKSALAILKVFAGDIAKELWDKTTVSVAKAEQMPLSGTEKARYVLGAIKSEWPEIKDHLANMLLELAVAYLKEGLLKK